MAMNTFKCARRSLVCRSTIRPTMVGSRKSFQNKDS